MVKFCKKKKKKHPPECPGACLQNMCTCSSSSPPGTAWLQPWGSGHQRDPAQEVLSAWRHWTAGSCRALGPTRDPHPVGRCIREAFWPWLSHAPRSLGSYCQASWMTSGGKSEYSRKRGGGEDTWHSGAKGQPAAEGLGTLLHQCSPMPPQVPGSPSSTVIFQTRRKEHLTGNFGSMYLIGW